MQEAWELGARMGLGISYPEHISDRYKSLRSDGYTFERLKAFLTGGPMKLIPFPEMMVTIAKDQAPYLPMPAWRAQDPEGTLVICWEVGWKDRLRVLFCGLLWQTLLTFNKPVMPLKLQAQKPEMAPPGPKERGAGVAGPKERR